MARRLVIPVHTTEEPMKPIAGTIAAAVISGVGMYGVGARTATLDAFTSSPAVVVSTPSPAVRSSAPGRKQIRQAPVSRRAQSASGVREDERRNDRSDDRDERSWTKGALIIGGSAASGAGVGGAVKGKKGALIGAAIGGGAASIYEATQRR
jgi:hypothetical protein